MPLFSIDFAGVNNSTIALVQVQAILKICISAYSLVGELLILDLTGFPISNDNYAKDLACKQYCCLTSVSVVRARSTLLVEKKSTPCGRKSLLM